MIRKCIRKPFNTFVTIEKPSTDSADANSWNEIDLRDDDKWSLHCERRAHRRPMRGNERVGDDQVIAERIEVFELYGDPETRQVLATYRLKYTDIDGTDHTLQVIARKVHPDNRWVELQCVENATVA